MIKKIKALLAGVALVALSSTASASPWSQTIDLNPDLKLSTGQSFSWTHDLKTDGFRPLQDLITDFTLSLRLYDDNDWAFEYAKADLPGLLDDKTWEVDNTWYSTGGNSLFGYLQLNLLGELSVTLKSLGGDFYLDKSRLTATGIQAVPEPGALALLGLGLAGLALVRRRRAQ